MEFKSIATQSFSMSNTGLILILTPYKMCKDVTSQIFKKLCVITDTFCWDSLPEDTYKDKINLDEIKRDCRPGPSRMVMTITTRYILQQSIQYIS